MVKNNILYVEISGRIGNDMFRIACAASLAKKMKCNYKAVIKRIPLHNDKYSRYEDYLTQFKDNILRNVDCIYEEELPSGTELFHYDKFKFIELPKKNNICLQGYFQSEKYFDKDLVKDIFSITDKTKNKLLSKYGSILSKKPTSINVRRGDYVGSDILKCGDVPFIKKAMEKIGNDNIFLITSDDLPWCRKNIQGNNIFYCDETVPSENLYLASLCQNNIISNSTYSWWGAWLNNAPDKKVIVESPWFFPKLEIRTPSTDIIPEDWITLTI